MKKILSVLAIMLAVVVQASAQQKFEGFSITYKGEYVSSDGKNYIIYPFEGKTAKEIYTMICTNVAKVYNSPHTVMSTVDDASVAIHAYSDGLFYQTSYLGIKFFYEGKYNLLIEIRDGRVKVHAPTFGMQTGQSEVGRGPKSAERILSSFFDSNGKVKRKRSVWKTWAEQKINGIYEILLGLGVADSKDNDW